MPTDVFSFASNEENHNLTHPNSLHDAYLVSWAVSETQPPQEIAVKVDLTLLGPRWDRLIKLSYGRVAAYRVDDFAGSGAGMDLRGGHGDLLAHEIRAAEDATFWHELVFAKGAVICVRFKDFDHRIEMLPESKRPTRRFQSP